MNRPRSMTLATCCLLLVALGPGGAVLQASASDAPARPPILQCAGDGPADPGDVQSATPPNSSVRLELDSSSLRSSYDRPNSSFGAAAAMADARLRNRFHLLVIDEQIGGVVDDEARWQLVQAGLRRVGTRLSELRALERRTMRRYANGQASRADLVRRLAMIRAEAVAMDENLVELRRTVQLRNRKEIIDSIRGRVQTFTGPVRSYLADGVRGEPSVPRVSVTATERGYVLAVVDGNRFLREAIRYDNRDRIGDPEITSSSEAADRVRELYPGTGQGAESALITALRYFTGRTQLVRSTISYQDGTTTTTFIDATTRSVFYEEKVQPLTRIPTTMAANVTEGDLRIRLRRTYRNGPANVSVVDAETGTPIEARIAIDGQSFGATGTDGYLWYVAPPVEYTLEVTARGQTTNVTVSPDTAPEP